MTTEIVNYFATGVLRHEFEFKSVYHETEENYVSTHQDSWILVDYIFYSTNDKTKDKSCSSTGLQLLGYLTLPTANECENVNLKIPNQVNGSDHLSLLAQFRLCFDATNQQPSASEMTSSAITSTTKL